MDKYPFLLTLKGAWAISERFGLNSFNLLKPIASNIEYEKGGEPENTRVFALHSENKQKKEVNFDDAPKGSVAIITVAGVMTRHDQWCGPVGTETIKKRIENAANHENIAGIMLRYDTGGGQINSIPPLISAIENAKKKVVVGTFVDDVMASAGLMTGSHADIVIASHQMAEVGSLGVMAMFRDDTPKLESEGIVFHSIKASQSKLKNEPIEKALEGDYKLLIEKELNPICQEAIEDLKAQRGDKINDDNVYAGEMYFAKNAVNNGLIDKIGNFEFAVSEITKMAREKNIKKLFSNNNKKIFNTNGKNKQTKTVSNKNIKVMNKTTIPALLMVLGYEILESNDDKFALTAEDIQKIQNFAIENFNKPLTFAGTSFDNDGAGVFSSEGLIQLNATLTNELLEANTKKLESEGKILEEAQKKHEAEIKAMQDKVKKLSQEPEGIELPNNIQSATKINNNSFVPPAEGPNKVDELHPWNKAALAIANGDSQYANFMMSTGLSRNTISVLQDELVIHGASTLRLDQMKEVLGDSHVADNQEIKDMMVAHEEISSLFPWRSTGIKDELPGLTLYAQEFLQARNDVWSEKGGFEIQADIIKVQNWQVSHRYTASEMWNFIESWLATKTKGTDPFQESLVQYLTLKMLAQIALVERPLNSIRGVYLKPEKGIAGRSINSMDGLLINIIRLVKDNRILVSKTGPGNYEFFDKDGNVNRNHIYYKIQDVIKSMPQAVREGFRWNVFISKEDLRERERFMKEVVAVNPNYNEVEKVENYDNFKIKGVPHWPAGCVIITLPNNILQGFREKNDDNRIYFEKEKRDTIVFMDGGYVIAPVLSGFKFKSVEKLKAGKGYYQRIFTNGEFGAFTPIPVVPNATNLSVKNHNVLLTQANTQNTEITNVEDAITGDIVYIIGGSNENPSIIKEDNSNFSGLIGDIKFNSGVIAKFQKSKNGNFVLLAQYQESSQGAVQFPKNEAEPSVGAGYLFTTNPNCDTLKSKIKNFADAVIGVPFTVLGGGGEHPQTIEKSGKFKHISSTWTGTEDNQITLVKRSFGDFIEFEN